MKKKYRDSVLCENSGNKSNGILSIILSLFHGF
jgi:hypothetical protein